MSEAPPKQGIYPFEWPRVEPLAITVATSIPWIMKGSDHDCSSTDSCDDYRPQPRRKKTPCRVRCASNRTCINGTNGCTEQH